MRPWFNPKIMLSQNRRNSNKKKRVKIYITPAWRHSILARDIHIDLKGKSNGGDCNVS